MKITAAGTLSIKDLTMTGGVDDNDEVTGSAIPTVSLNGGGAIFNDGGTLVLQRVVLTGNAANNPIGGAIANSGGSLGMTDVTFSQNSAAVGGALRIRSGTVTGTGVTFAGNYGEFGGGSVYIDGGSLALVNSTLDGSAGLDGYGIGVQNAGGTVSLLNDTISASQGYALETDRGASTTVENTIIGQGGRGDCVPANGSDSVDDGTTVAAVTVDVGNNVDQTGDCHLDGSGDQTGDPGIAPLADNGGPTKTDALLVDSPAIDSGNGDGCPDTDQRGVSRSSECDIGAYAAQFLGGPSATTSDAQVNGPNDATLSATVDTAGEGGAYAFEWGTTPNLGNETPLLAAGIASGQTVQADLPGLAPAQTYYFSAVAENASGRSQDEQILSFTTSAATPTVSDVTVSDVFDTTVTVGGTVDPGGDATSYWIEYGPTADLGSQTAATPIGSTPGEQSVQQALTGLDPGTLYYARIVATNPEGTTDGTTTTFTTGPQFAATSGVLLTAGPRQRLLRRLPCRRTLQHRLGRRLRPRDGRRRHVQPGNRRPDRLHGLGQPHVRQPWPLRHPRDRDRRQPHVRRRRTRLVSVHDDDHVAAASAVAFAAHRRNSIGRGGDCDVGGGERVGRPERVADLLPRRVWADRGVRAADRCGLCRFGYVGAGGERDAFGVVAGDDLSRPGRGHEPGRHHGELRRDVHDHCDRAAAAGPGAEPRRRPVLGQRARERAAADGRGADSVRLDHRRAQRHDHAGQHRADRAASVRVLHRCDLPGRPGGGRIH